MIIDIVDTGLSLCQETAERKLEAKVTELQQLMEEVKMLKDSVQEETGEKNKLQATITDKDVCLERALADTDRLKAQLAEKEEKVGLVCRWDTRHYFLQSSLLKKGVQKLKREEQKHGIC